MKASKVACILFFISSLNLLASQRPNVVLFLVDDMGWRDSSTYGSAFYETPSMDRLAAGGMTFTQAYAQPLCSPTRAAIMSGKYGARLHLHKAITRGSVASPSIKPNPKKPADAMIWPESRSHLPLEEHTIAEALQENGYQTWFLGKWHLGGRAYFPEKQGFDKVISAGGAGPRSYFAPYQNIPGLEDAPEGEYVCDRLTQEACDLLEGSGKDKPFFMMLAHFNVHSPYQAKQELIDKYKAKSDSSYPQHHPVMGAMVQSMDESLGTILDKLDELDLTKNTLFIFMSDNGGVNWANSAKRKGSPGFEFKMPITSNSPLRGGKASFYEGGVRVPMIIRYPGEIASGSKTDALAHAVDLYPTVLDFAKMGRRTSHAFDGKSLKPVLFGEQASVRNDLYCHFPRVKTTASEFGGSFVREGDLKLIRLWGGGPDGQHAYELYNLSEDIGETRNLASEHPAVVSRLSAKLDIWLQETGALLPARNAELMF